MANDYPIHSDPEIMGGEVVFVGTRVPGYNLFDYLEAGDSLDEFLAQYPSVAGSRRWLRWSSRKRQLLALRILLDESLPVAFAALLTNHQVATVRAQHWLGLRNGVLLRAAVDAGFEVIVTADKALRRFEMTAIMTAIMTDQPSRVRSMGSLRPTTLLVRKDS